MGKISGLDAKSSLRSYVATKCALIHQIYHFYQSDTFVLKIMSNTTD